MAQGKNASRGWLTLATVIVGSFAVLLYFGREIYLQAPPIPAQVVSRSGEILYTQEDIQNGQNVWQSIGGQEVGTVWGHGAYVAPDWSADWLHRESDALLGLWARAQGSPSFAELSPDARLLLEARLKRELRENSYDAATGKITLTDDRAQAIHEVEGHYRSLFGSDPALAPLRESYAIPADSLKEPHRFHQLNAFFFWASWATVTQRPDGTVSYTQNWPHDERVGNVPAASLLIWSIVSILFLLVGVAVVTWRFAVAKSDSSEEAHAAPERDPAQEMRITPSMRATLKYFWVVVALFALQVGLGVVTAHYGVEGEALYGIPIGKWIPYAVTRTWHTQAGIFWIATAWLATGLFLVPVISGREPRGQRFGVNFLFFSLLVIVAGSFFGEWLGVQQKLGATANFWFGHQGYEYVDLGRFWQAFLLVGLVIWLGLMSRGIIPALRKPGTTSGNRELLWMFLLSSTAIAGFYSPGLMWGQHSHLSIAEYWRWWVVHLWVEGFFEVFATVAIAFLFTQMQLISPAKAARATIGSATLFLLGGILGTFHHVYFAGTPLSVLAIGASFSALEVVPLVLVGHEAWENLRMSRARPWVQSYRWPIYFFLAVAFWNFVGAGVFGFMINTPIALYYMQGLNTTPVHGHTALFGVYGMLGIGFMLFCMKHLTEGSRVPERVLRWSFWCLNAGLALMVLLSLLPIGILQTQASIAHGMWYARSADFMQSPEMRLLKWLRVPGDVIFALGVLGVAVYVLGGKLKRRNPPETRVAATASGVATESTMT